jgi:pimeloyl-ACP methyl ester carboxylesterase
MLSRYPKFRDRVFRNSGMNVDMVRHVRDDVVATGALGPAINWYRAIPFGHRGYLRKVSVPTTYVWSTHDVALGRRCAELCERYVTGPYRFEVTDGSHWIPDEEPRLVHDLILDGISGDVFGSLLDAAPTTQKCE